jgi:hypothetical protein
VRRENSVEPGNLENLLHQSGLAADPELSAVGLQLLADGHKRSQTHAADIGEIAYIDY